MRDQHPGRATASGSSIQRSEACRVVVIILTFNQKEKTLRCLDHVLAMEGPPFEVLVWDNGSVDGTLESIRERHSTVLVHRHPRNLGVASGRNAAAELALERFSPTHFLFLDNDIEVERGFLTALLDGFSEDVRVGQTQAKLRFIRDRTRLNDGGGCRISFWRGRTMPVGFNEIDRGQYDERRRCVACGGAMMTRAEVFRQLGGFDSKFDPVGPEDLDYSLRLQRTGYFALYVPEAVAYHEVSHTFGGGAYSEEYAKHKARNWFTFLLRHAPLHQKIGFFCLSAPFLVLRLIVREGKKGNFGAISGMLRGIFDIARRRRRRFAGD
jgi:GT2 family glycosyltransferase